VVRGGRRREFTVVTQKATEVESGDAQATISAINRWIVPNPHRPSEMVLPDYGVSVWALVGYARGVGGQDSEAVAEVARAYEVPPDAVRAALAHYRRHPLQIDAKLDANAAWHVA
jgi:hypothetical protein